MKRNYYFLVAGLPGLVLDGGKQAVAVREFVAETAPLLHPSDAALLNLALYPVDNRNLLALLQKHEDAFEAGGFFSRDELAQEIKAPDSAPAYMVTFIDAFKNGRLPLPELSAQDNLAWLFYDEVCTSPEPFVRRWFCFDRNLRNVCAAYNCRIASSRSNAPQRAFSLQKALVGHDEITEAIQRSNAQDFSLSAALPWIERLSGMPRDNLVDFEKGIDTIRWDMLDELTALSYFTVDVILAFTFKLGMVNRWQVLDEQHGKDMFDRLVKDLVSGFSIANA